MVEQRQWNGINQIGIVQLNLSHLASGWYNVKMVTDLGVQNLKFQKN
jgi:hypothetical protein